jgi:hypothetical protein
MVPRLFTLACAVSLMLSVATATLWVRSHMPHLRPWESLFVMRSVQHNDGDGAITTIAWSLYVDTHDGDTAIGFDRDLGDFRLPRWKVAWDDPDWVRPIGYPTGSVHFGCYYWDIGDHDGYSRGVLVPGWMPPIAFVVLPAAWVFLWRRRVARRNRNGLCTRCGYDLRASNDRCPECGTPIAPKAETPA